MTVTDEELLGRIARADAVLEPYLRKRGEGARHGRRPGP